MSNETDLMQRLAVSKKIMEKHNEIKRGDSRPSTPSIDNFEPVNAKYNLPEEFLSESAQKQRVDYDPSQPLAEEKIMNSKLPDEIKRLMIEQPIVQPSSLSGGATLSDNVIEGASRLMKKEKISEIPKAQTPKQKIVESHTSPNININEIKNMIRDVVRDTVKDVVKEELKNAGMLTESTTDSDETIQFKVGKHLFVGRVTKIKKLQ
jgi:hypothetical protein